MSDTDVYQQFAALALSNLVSTDDLLLLLAAHSTDKLVQEKPHESYDRFDIDNFTNAQCCGLFQFDKEDLVHLSQLLALPDRYEAQNGLVWDPLEGTYLLLHRLCYPGCLFDLAPYFGRSVH